MLYSAESPPSRCLYYVMDPMCSWCWAFAPQWRALRERLPPSLPGRVVLGGLAPDSDRPMPAALREQIRQTWRQIERITGTPFNHAFWQRNTPRRATYPACRAVLAADALEPGAGERMIAAIQRAYYQEARNPSDTPVLVALAERLALDPTAFAEALASEAVARRLDQHLALRHRLGVRGYPALVWQEDGRSRLLVQGYLDRERLWERVRQAGI